MGFLAAGLSRGQRSASLTAADAVVAQLLARSLQVKRFG